MYKPLHYLFTRACQLVLALVAFFAVGLTASAEHYHIDFCQAGEQEFGDGAVMVATTTATTASGLKVTQLSELQMFMQINGAKGEGIGRVVFNVAPNTDPDRLRTLLDRSFRGTGYFSLLEGDKLVFTPSTCSRVCSIQMSDDEELFKPITIVSAEVFSGYSVDPTKYQDLDYITPSTGVLSFTGNVSYTSTPDKTWRSVSSSDDTTPLPVGYFVTSQNAKCVLSAERGNFFMGSAAGLEIETTPVCPECVFRLYAPAGFAIGGVRFVGTGLDGLTAERGEIVGNMDLLWVCPDARPSSNSATFTYNGSGAHIERITVSYVPLSAKYVTKFAINPAQVWPTNEEFVREQVFGRIFPITISGLPGEITATSSDFTIDALIDGDMHSLSVSPELLTDEEYTAACFQVELPESFKLSASHSLLMRFPEGCFFKGDSPNGEFVLHFDYVVPGPTVEPVETVYTTGAIPASGAVNLDEFDKLPVINGFHGLLVTFDEPLFGADGPLAHGTTVWGSTPDGFSFAHTAADGSVNSINAYAWAYNDSQAGVYGLFFPISQTATSVRTGQYDLILPTGCLFFRGGKVNDEAIFSWNFVNAEPDGSFAVVYPKAGKAVRSIDRLEVESQVSTHYVGIVSVSDYVLINYFDHNTGKSDIVGATGYISGNRAIFAFDYGFTAETEDKVTFTIPAGSFTTSNGRCNGDITATVTVNSNLKTSRPINTDPSSTTPASIESASNHKYAEDLPGFLVRYSSDVLAESPDGHLWTTYPDGFLFTYTSTTGSMYDISWIWSDVMAYNPAGSYVKALDIPMSAYNEGTYHLVVPEGSFQLEDGSYNAEIDCTWNMIHTFSGDLFEVVYPTGGSGITYPYIDHLVVHPTAEAVAQYGDDISIVRGSSETVSVDYDYINQQGQRVATDVDATVALDADGNAVLNFSQRIAQDYPTDFTFKVRTGSFYCANGNGNDGFWTPETAPYHVEKPVSFWLSTDVEPMQQMPTPAFSTVNITSTDPLSALGQNQMMDIRVLDLNDKTEYINGKYAPKSVSITANAQGQSVLSIVLPDEVVAAMSVNDNEKEVFVNLPGYDPSVAGTSADNCFVKNTDGLPNEPVKFYFLVNPQVTYTYKFSYIAPTLVDYTVTIDGVTKAANENGGVMFENIGRLLKAGDITVGGIKNGVALSFSYPEYDYAISTYYVKVNIEDLIPPAVEILSCENTNLNFPAGTISRDLLPQGSTPFSLVFNNIIDDETFSQAIFEQHVTITDAQGTAYHVGWASVGGQWLGFGLDNWDDALPVGTYTFHIDADIFKFMDGQSNPAVDFTVTVTGGVKFEYTSLAAAEWYDEKWSFNESTWELPNPLYSFALAYDPERFSFAESQSVEVTVYTDENMGITFSGYAFPVIDNEGKSRLVFSFPTDAPEQLRLITQSGQATIWIQADAFRDDNGAANEEMFLWFNIADYKCYNIYVDGKLTHGEGFLYKDPGLRNSYALHSGDRVANADFGAISWNGNLFEFIGADYDGINVNYNFRFKGTDEYHLSGYNVDGTAGLRAATLTFGEMLNPLYFRKRVEWDEGFKIKRKRVAALHTTEYVAVTDIEYADITVESNQLTLRFYDNEGNELFPLEAGPTYYLEIPMHSLFAYSNALGGFASAVPPGCTPLNLAYEYAFTLATVQEMQILTEDDVANQTINQSTPHKVAGLADILLEKHRNVERTNDIDGNGSVSIADIVRLIHQAQQRAVSDDDTTAPEPDPEGWHPVAVGSPSDPGDEAL